MVIVHDILNLCLINLDVDNLTINIRASLKIGSFDICIQSILFPDLNISFPSNCAVNF